MPLTAQDVAEITRLLEESEFDELHIEHEGLKLTLRRGAAAGHTPARAPAAPQPAAAAASTAAPAPAVEPYGEHAEVGSRGPRRGQAAPASSLLDITSPLVGIFYRAPKPGAPPFIEVGSAVEPDSIIGIIEVMKLMHTVRAEATGTIAEILVADGAAVEYAQVLARITPGAPRG